MNKTQQFTNQTVSEVWEQFENEAYLSDIIHEERLLTCSAWVRRYENIDGNFSKYVGLKSYGTMIAVFDTENNILYDALRKVYGYTATSAQHIAKFRNVMREKLGLKWGDIVTMTYRN